MTRTGLQPSLEAFEDGSADILLLHESVKGEVFIYKDSERKGNRFYLKMTLNPQVYCLLWLCYDISVLSVFLTYCNIDLKSVELGNEFFDQCLS